MSFSVIAYIAPNYRDYNNYWLKAYEPGTTTPKPMATDSTLSVLIAKAEINEDGFIKSAGGALIVPYVEDSYDLWLFPTEAEADANNTVNAERVADNITGPVPADLLAVARALNVPIESVTSDAAGQVVTEYIYAVDQQKTYSVPSDAIGKIIDSVVVDVLNTTVDGPYDLIEITSYQKVFYASNYTLDTLLDFNNIQEDIIASGQLSIKLVFTDKITFVGSQAIGVTLSNLDSFVVEGMAVEDTFIYPDGQQSTLFKLTDVKNVEIHGSAKSTLTNIGTTVSAEKVALTTVKVDGCDTFIRIGSNEQMHRDYEVQNTKNITARTVNHQVMYPNLVFDNCGVIDINSVNTECRRNFFIYNATGGKVTIDSTDEHLWSLVKHYVDPANPSRETSNVDIKYKARGASPSARHGARTAPVALEVNTDPLTISPVSVMRNINIEYDVDADYGTVLGVVKQLNDESEGDNTARGYILDKIEVSGRHVSNINDQCFYLNWKEPGGGGASWVAGDSITGFDFRKLLVKNSGGGSGYVKLNLEQITDAVVLPDMVRIDRVIGPDTRIDSTTDYEGKVKFTSAELEVFTTKDTEVTARTLLVRNNWFEILIADAGVMQIATIPSFRTITSVQIDITAHRNDAGNVVAGNFSGVVLFASLPPGIIRNGWTETYATQPGTVNPVLTVTDAGLLSISIPEWNASDIHVSANIKLSYDEYNSPNGALLEGLVNKAYSIDV